MRVLYYHALNRRVERFPEWNPRIHATGKMRDASITFRHSDGQAPDRKSSVIPIDVMALFLLFKARSKALSAPKRLGGIAPEG